jgi:hypothetical protein
MATYLIKKEITITRQEGDSADIVIVVPNVIDMSLYDAQFQVRDTTLRRLIISKTSNAGISIAGQTLTIPLATDDTKNKAGKHRWELQLSNNTPEIITIGRGTFIIVNELIR